MSEEQTGINITEDEAALYDRQIRLWGLDAQRRLRASKVLLVGLGGLGAEVAKNIVLSGIHSLTLLDSAVVTEEEICSQFLIPREDLGKNRATSSQHRTQLLNPMVEVKAENDSIANKDEEYIAQFDVVCVTCSSEKELIRVNEICRKREIMFFAGDVFGYYGSMFSDLGKHNYAEEVTEKKKVKKDDAAGEPASKKAKYEDETKTVKKTIDFKPFKDVDGIDWSSEDYSKRLKRTPVSYFILRILLAFREKFGRAPSTKSLAADREELASLRESTLSSMKVDATVVPEDFLQYCFAELSPVCAVTGGVLGQEIIKAVSQKDTPHNNFFFYNGVEGSGMVDLIC